LLVVAIAVGSAGCETTVGSTTNPNPDARTDATDFTPPGSIAIRVRNDGTKNLYVQASGWSGQEVTSIVLPGAGTVGRDSCEICNCNGCPDCAVCGRGLATVAELVPGASLDFPWDQTDWDVIEEGCRPSLSCEQPSLIAPGPLTAVAAYSDSFMDTTEFGAQESFIGPRVTAQTEFQHPATDVVVVSIQ